MKDGIATFGGAAVAWICAQFSAPPIEMIGGWVWAAFGVLGFLYFGLQCWNAFQAARSHRTPMAEEVELILEKINGIPELESNLKAVQINFMPRREIEGQIARLDRYTHDLRHEMRNELNAIKVADEERAVKLHDRINKVLEGVAELKGELKRMPGRINHE